MPSLQPDFMGQDIDGTVDSFGAATRDSGRGLSCLKKDSRVAARQPAAYGYAAPPGVPPPFPAAMAGGMSDVDQELFNGINALI